MLCCCFWWRCSIIIFFFFLSSVSYILFLLYFSYSYFSPTFSVPLVLFPITCSILPLFTFFWYIFSPTFFFPFLRHYLSWSLTTYRYFSSAASTTWYIVPLALCTLLDILLNIIMSLVALLHFDFPFPAHHTTLLFLSVCLFHIHFSVAPHQSAHLTLPLHHTFLRFLLSLFITWTFLRLCVASFSLYLQKHSLHTCKTLS